MHNELFLIFFLVIFGIIILGNLFLNSNVKRKYEERKKGINRPDPFEFMLSPQASIYREIKSRNNHAAPITNNRPSSSPGKGWMCPICKNRNPNETFICLNCKREV